MGTLSTVIRRGSKPAGLSRAHEKRQEWPHPGENWTFMQFRGLKVHRRYLTLAAAVIGATAGAAGGLATLDGPADDAALALRIRAHMRQYVEQLPDYTCRVTLERFRRLKPSST